MDGRWPLLLLAGFLSAAGCTPDKLLPKETAGETASTPAAAKTFSKPPVGYPEPIAPEPVKELKPKTLVALAALREQMAVETARSAAQKEAFLEEARRAYEQALKSDPNYLPAHIGLARHWELIGQPERARQGFEKAMKLAPQDGELHFEAGMSHARRKDWPAALTCLRRAVELEPQNRRFISTYALMLARAERFDDSLIWLKKVYSEAEAHATLARMLHHLGKEDLCRQHLDAALQRDPHCQPALELCRELEQELVRTSTAQPAP